MTKVTKNVRGPSIARETAKGKPTVYAVCKTLWSTRGKIVNKASAKFGEIGEPIAKSVVLAALMAKDKESAAPVLVKRVGRGVHLIAA